MPGLSRFARKQPSTAGVGAPPPAPPAAAGNNGDGSGGDAGAQSAVPPTNANSGGVNNNDVTAVTNFSSSLDDNRPSTSGSINAFADIGNMFANMDDQAMTMGGGAGANSNMLDSTTFLSSTPTEGGGEMTTNNHFMQGFESRPSTGEGENTFQFGNLAGFDSEGVAAAANSEQPTTTANGGNETNDTTKRHTADAPEGSGIGGRGGIGLFAKRRAIQAAATTEAAATVATSNPTGGQVEVTKTVSSSSPKNDSGSSVANLSQFDTTLLSESKNEIEEGKSSTNVQIPKSIATGNGGDVEDDLTVGTNTSVVAAAAARDGVFNAAPSAAKSPYFSNSAINDNDVHASTSKDVSNVTAEEKLVSAPSPDKEEIIIPGMDLLGGTANKSGESGIDMNVTDEMTKQDGVVAPNTNNSQRVSLSPPKPDANSIVIPGMPSTTATAGSENMNTSRSMVQFGGAAEGNANAAVSAANTQPVFGNNSHPSVLGNSRGIGRFNSNEKVKFSLPESTTKTTTAASKNAANIGNNNNTTAITPDHRKGAKQGLSAVTPTPHKTVQYEATSYDRTVPGMPTAEMQIVDNDATMKDSVRSPTPTTNTNSDTPKASNIGGYSGTSMIATHESFDELLSQLANDLSDSTDIHNQGERDLLSLEVAISHAYAKVLRTKGQYLDLLGAIESVASSFGDEDLIALE